MRAAAVASSGGRSRTQLRCFVAAVATVFVAVAFPGRGDALAAVRAAESLDGPAAAAAAVHCGTGGGR